MKYVLLLTACAAVSTALAWLGYRWSFARAWLLTAIVASTCLASKADIRMFHVQDYRGTETGITLFLTDVLCVGLALALVARFPKRVTWLPYNWVAMAVLFAWSVASAMGADNQDFAVFTLFTMLRGFLLYWCVSNALRLGVETRYIFYGMTIVGLVVGAVAAKQFLFDRLFRVTALFEHSNTIPSYCFLITPALLLWAIGDPRRRVWESLAGVLAAGGMCFAIVYSFSRVGLLLLGASLVVTVAVAVYLAPNRRVMRTAAAVLILAMLGSMVTADSVARRFSEAPAASGISRVELNDAAWLMAGDRVLGVGPNNFVPAMMDTPRYREHIVVLATETMVPVCHNLYMLTAAEIGWPGLVIFLVLMGRFLWLTMAGAVGGRPEGLLLFGLSVGWIAMLLNGITEWVLRQAPALDLYVITAALAVGLVAERRAAAWHEVVAPAAAGVAPPLSDASSPTAVERVRRNGVRVEKPQPAAPRSEVRQPVDDARPVAVPGAEK